MEQQTIEAGAPATEQPETDRTDGDWRVIGLRSKGRVLFSGKHPFTCRYAAMEGYEMDESSQEMAVHDAQRARIFTDFVWKRTEPPPKMMQELLAKLQRVGQAAVIGR